MHNTLTYSVSHTVMEQPSMITVCETHIMTGLYTNHRQQLQTTYKRGMHRQNVMWLKHRSNIKSKRRNYSVVHLKILPKSWHLQQQLTGDLVIKNQVQYARLRDLFIIMIKNNRLFEIKCSYRQFKPGKLYRHHELAIILSISPLRC